MDNEMIPQTAEGEELRRRAIEIILSLSEEEAAELLAWVRGCNHDA